MGRRFAEAAERLMEEAARHVKEGRLDDAADAYRRALRYQPNEWIVLAHLGACERFRGRWDEAERALNRALVVRPEEPGTLNELGLVMAASGRPIDAIAFFERATRSAPGFLQGWCNLGKLLYVEVLEGSGPSARAIECFDRILALDPAQHEFRFLRDALRGNAVQAPPAGYVAAFFDRFAATFDEKVAGRLAYSAPEVASRMLGSLLQSRQGLTVLDLGCGTGLSGAIVRGSAAHLVGVDVSDGMLERARAAGIYDRLEQRELQEFLDGAEPEAHDLALALDVFIYVGALERVLPAIGRTLKPCGRAVFSVETAQGVGYSLARSGRFCHSRAYVEGLASAAGLRLIEAREFTVRAEAGQGIAAVMFLYERG